MKRERHSLYKSKNLHVFAITHGPPSGTLIAGFQNMIPEPSLDLPGFGESIVDQQKSSGVFINCAHNAWWQYEDMPEALKAAKGFAQDWSQIATYGSSMGGYAAIRFAADLGAVRSVAFSPQFSIQRRLVPFEGRYQNYATSIDFVRDEAVFPRDEECVYTIGYDPLYRVDRLHVEAYKQHITVTDLKVRCSGHPSLKLLADYGVVRSVAFALLAGNFSNLELRNRERAARRSTALYWKELSFRLLEHGHHSAAMAAAQQLVEVAIDKASAYRHAEQISKHVSLAQQGKSQV